MKWFKHDGNARGDEKIEKLLMKFGVEGYGLYFYCIEIIAGNLTSDNITFELKHDAETLAYRLKMDTLRVEEIMKWCVSAGLFQYNQSTERIMCLGLGKRLDITTSSNPEVKKIVSNYQELLESNSDYQHLLPEEKRLEETRKEEKNTEEYSLISAVVEYLNEKTESSYKSTTESTRRLIRARLSDGFELVDFRRVIDSKVDEWGADDKMRQYLRPATLFGTKFESYLQAASPKSATSEEERNWHKF